MRMEIIQQRQRHETIRYGLGFTHRDTFGGFNFDCDKDGNLLEMKPAAQENLRKCQDGTYDVIAQGIQEFRSVYTSPRVGKCHCGEEVSLGNFTNTCYQCGTDYNMSGDSLAPREQWGEETGEHWTECI